MEKHYNFIAAAKKAAAHRDGNQRYELQVLSQDMWKGIGLAADVAMLIRLARGVESSGKKARVMDWFHGKSVQESALQA